MNFWTGVVVGAWLVATTAFAKYALEQAAEQKRRRKLMAAAEKAMPQVMASGIRPTLFALDTCKCPACEARRAAESRSNQ